MATSPHTCAHTCQPLPSAAKGLQPGLCPPPATTRAAFASRPSAVMRPRLFCPNSRELSSISRKCAPACATPPSAAKGPPARPVLARPTTRRARPSPASRLPSCAQNFLPNLTHSLVNSRVTLIHLACLSTPSNAAKMLLTSIPFETGTLPANATTVSWPSRLPLRNTKYEIRNSAPNLLLPPCKSLHHRISCTHRRKSKATANHLCTFTNVGRLTEQPQLQDHNAARTRRDTLPPPQNFFGESKATHEFTRQFAPLRATLILTARTRQDTEQGIT